MFTKKLPWPLPAVLVWLVAWCVFYILQTIGFGFSCAFVVSICLSIALSIAGSTWWRKGFIAFGFPVSALLLTSSVALADLHPWIWLIPLAVLLCIYPIRAWQDAPLFPTPTDTLKDLQHYAPLPARANIMDAGCGLGHGLKALRKAYPDAEITGIEWSWLLSLACRLRCPWATIQRGDIWQIDWLSFDMVYLFQRPESMPRAIHKAIRDLKPGAWMVSLEFEAQALISTTQIQTSSGKMLWLYQAPLKLKDPGDS